MSQNIKRKKMAEGRFTFIKKERKKEKKTKKLNKLRIYQSIQQMR